MTDLTNQLTTTLQNIKDAEEVIKHLETQYSPTTVKKQFNNELKENNQKPSKSEVSKRALTLNEFNSGALLITSLEENYRTLAIDLSIKIQKEFDCKSTIEKTLAESISMYYVQSLFLTSKVTRYLELSSITDMGIRYLAVISKELDRTNRHYLTSMQALREMKQPPMSLTVKATTAVVGNNQIVQTNQHE